LPKGIENLPRKALPFDPPLAAGTMRSACARMVVFDLLEQGKHVLPGPPRVALSGPAVVVGGLTPHVDHAVDGGASTQHAATRVAQTTAVQPGVGRGGVAPIGALVANAIEVANGNVDPPPVVATAGFQQQNTGAGIGGETVCKQTAGGTGADDDVI